MTIKKANHGMARLTAVVVGAENHAKVTTALPWIVRAEIE